VILSLYLALVPAVRLLALQHARCCQHGRRWTTASISDTSLVVSSGVDCGRRWRNVYDTKPQRYAKDSDKSVAYVTNNKRRHFVLLVLELTTDRHKASRGLFVTA